MKRWKKTLPTVRFSSFSETASVREGGRYSLWQVSRNWPFVALGAALFVVGCSSDSLKRPFETASSGPTSTGVAPLAESTSPLPTATETPIAPNSAPVVAESTLVAGTDYVEANAAATPPLGTTYYRVGTESAVAASAVLREFPDFAVRVFSALSGRVVAERFGGFRRRRLSKRFSRGNAPSGRADRRARRR